MNTVDLCCFAFLFLLGARGTWRGFVNEWAGLIGLLSGYFFAVFYSPTVDLWLKNYLDFSPDYSFIASGALVFLGTYLIVVLVGAVFTKILKVVWLGWLNRLLGGLSGLLKGAIVLAFAIAIYNGHLVSFFGARPWVGESLIFDFLSSFGGYLRNNPSFLTDGVDQLRA